MLVITSYSIHYTKLYDFTSRMFKNIAVAIITPTHTKKSFEMGLGLAKKLDANLSVIECVYKIPPKFYFFETKSDKQITEKQTSQIKKEFVITSYSIHYTKLYDDSLLRDLCYLTNIH